MARSGSPYYTTVCCIMTICSLVAIVEYNSRRTVHGALRQGKRVYTDVNLHWACVKTAQVLPHPGNKAIQVTTHGPTHALEGGKAHVNTQGSKGWQDPNSQQSYLIKVAKGCTLSHNRMHTHLPPLNYQKGEDAHCLIYAHNSPTAKGCTLQRDVRIMSTRTVSYMYVQPYTRTNAPSRPGYAFSRLGTCMCICLGVFVYVCL